jgi:hypothetical protein
MLLCLQQRLSCPERLHQSACSCVSHGQPQTLHFCACSLVCPGLCLLSTMPGFPVQCKTSSTHLALANVSHLPCACILIPIRPVIAISTTMAQMLITARTNTPKTACVQTVRAEVPSEENRVHAVKPGRSSTVRVTCFERFVRYHLSSLALLSVAPGLNGHYSRYALGGAYCLLCRVFANVS